MLFVIHKEVTLNHSLYRCAISGADGTITYS